MSQYPLPSTDSNTFTVYSINPCPYCRKAKQLLTENQEQFNIVDCNDYKKNDRENFLAFIHKLTQSNHSTFPIVFHGDKFIGGFDKLSIYYEDIKSTKNLINKQLVETDDF